MTRRAIILAAGSGSRLRPLTDRLPKTLVEVGGTPILLHTLGHLRAVGVREVVLVIGYQGRAIRDRVGATFLGMKVHYVDNPQFATTNNIVSLRLAADYLRGEVFLLEG